MRLSENRVELLSFPPRPATDRFIAREHAEQLQGDIPMLRISIAIVLFTASFLIMSQWDPRPFSAQTQLQEHDEQAQLTTPTK
jgi:hypothetical protein